MKKTLDAISFSNDVVEVVVDDSVVVVVDDSVVVVVGGLVVVVVFGGRGWFCSRGM